MKRVLGVYSNPKPYWLGDGFPVRSFLYYQNQNLGTQITPFLLLQYAGPHHFEPRTVPRGIGPHPHRGFETVTIVYDGGVAHRDSMGNYGIIGPGDVEWTTAGRGIIHDEFHSPQFTKTGGPFRMIQLWINLPAKDKRARPAYQSIVSAEIPEVELLGSDGKVRVIAGVFGGRRGPAKTFTSINVWDVRLNADASVTLDVPDKHNSAVIVVSGRIKLAGSRAASEAEMVLLSKDGAGVALHAESDAVVLVLTGEPIDEPIAGYGPVIMNTEAEIQEAFEDLRSGRFGGPANASPL
ncbi:MULTISPECIES: pirin family protein [unclassified Bradyrhizobium]|uniref:pirin family protein n=1 Tax=unclassified Bradyrhizobium TaxID=2631580 RepID=UPI0024795ADF|nr:MULTISPECIES: pirin family protein [unclassified Bradyrhizobium]WGR73169.1 pirin family protein [Bradyrhizobium sp. ISRA426]WGR78008.1 pirin family protein [Bradyrhizobium sp. ISRA430]WGR88409.1 pirin family protein [Bradyrhizobium sp. ISRA432]